MYERYGKRLLDVSLAGLAIVALAPLFAALALILLFTQGRPVLFRQTRAGLNGTPFDVLKFRSMRPEQDGVSRDARVTAVGRIFRRLSLDELPQLINVLRGEMSLVGPRPLHVRYVERYSPEHKMRLAVKPGLTGLAQVSGRNALAWELRLDLDVTYIRSVRLATDARLMVRTVAVLLKPKENGRDTAPSAEYLGRTEDQP